MMIDCVTELNLPKFQHDSVCCGVVVCINPALGVYRFRFFSVGFFFVIFLADFEKKRIFCDPVQ